MLFRVHNWLTGGGRCRRVPLGPRCLSMMSSSSCKNSEGVRVPCGLVFSPASASEARRLEAQRRSGAERPPWQAKKKSFLGRSFQLTCHSGSAYLKGWPMWRMVGEDSQCYVYYWRGQPPGWYVAPELTGKEFFLYQSLMFHQL